MRAVSGGIVNRDGGPIDQRDLDLFAARARLPWGGKPRIQSGEGFGLVWIPAFPDGEGIATHADAGRFSGRYRAPVLTDASRR